MAKKTICINSEIANWRKKLKALKAHMKNTPTDPGPWVFEQRLTHDSYHDDRTLMTVQKGKG